MHQIFISYSHEDQTVAERLYRDIKKAGHTPWIDTCDLQAGENWRYRITEVISECDYFLALLSKRSLSKRGFVQQELRLALEALQKFPVDDQFIIPVRIEVCCPKNLQLECGTSYNPSVKHKVCIFNKRIKSIGWKCG